MYHGVSLDMATVHVTHRGPHTSEEPREKTNWLPKVNCDTVHLNESLTLIFLFKDFGF